MKQFSEGVKGEHRKVKAPKKVTIGSQRRIVAIEKENKPGHEYDSSSTPGPPNYQSENIFKRVRVLYITMHYAYIYIYI